MKLSHITPFIFAFLTGHKRQIIRYGEDFQWNNSSWTHNTFRVYELIFGRRAGIRREVTAFADDSGYSYQVAHTWEAAIAILEGEVRAVFKFWKYSIPKIYVPVLNTPQGFPIASPYLFAIARDTTGDSTPVASGSSYSWNHTCTGSNLYMVCGTDGVNQTVSNVTYNSIALTQRQVYLSGTGALLKNEYLHSLSAPATGTHSVSVTLGGSINIWSKAISASYSGVDQSTDFSSVHNSAESHANSATTWTSTVTVNVANSFLVLFADLSGVNGTVGTNTSVLLIPVDNYYEPNAYDSTAAVGTGSQSLVLTSSSANGCLLIAALAPTAAAVATARKSIIDNYIIYN